MLTKYNKEYKEFLETQTKKQLILRCLNYELVIEKYEKRQTQ